jgi:hypothetical protein
MEIKMLHNKARRKRLYDKVAQARRLEAFFKEKKVPFRRFTDMFSTLTYEISFGAIPFIPKEVGYFWQHDISVIQVEWKEVAL